MLSVEKYYEMLALNKALMEVRFLGGDIDVALRGSAPLADLHSRLIDELIDHHRRSGEDGKVASWEQWRVFASRGLEIQSIIGYFSPMWSGIKSETVKRQALEAQMRPFIFDDGDVDRLYQEIERRARG
ncbi:hypothetical protein ACQP2E_29420 [Actinoplanes sp. CA-015351]|uniref:hypothetical protein n=1 Tax=Actinoplanes sp. CA-015351 TaxID=3239897 RepID=UPI003D984D98